MARKERTLARRIVRTAKNSPWLLIALGLHVIAGAALSVIVIQHGRRKAAVSGTSIAVAPVRSESAPPVVPELRLDRLQIPERRKAELVSYAEAEAFVPTETPDEIDRYADVGDPTGSEGDDGSYSGSSSIGAGLHGGRRSGGVSPWLGGHRPGATRGPGKPGRPAGERVATEEAVLEGLRWLMRHQEEDGAWRAGSLHLRCTKRPCIPADVALDGTFDVGMTALALLAFLGQGISLDSEVLLADPALGRPERPAREIVKRGLRWLMKQQKPDGSFSDSAAFELPENDTLPAMALCEAYGLSRNSRLRAPAQRALDFLVAAQKRAEEGTLSGWGVGSMRALDEALARGEIDEEAYREGCARVDLAITCWAVMALRAAQSCGLSVPDEVLAGGLAYAAGAEGERVLAPAGEPPDAFTRHAARGAALGMLVRAFGGGAIDDPFLARAARELAADPPRVTRDGLSLDFYYWYFATLALEQYDGPESPRAERGAHWEPWNAALVEALLPLQDRTRARDDCARGGWLQEARGNRRGRALYNTALNVLTLEVYYRFENVFGLREK